MLGLAGGTTALPAGLRRRGGRTASGAKAVACVPCQQRARGGGKFGLTRGQRGKQAAQFAKAVAGWQIGMVLNGGIKKAVDGGEAFGGHPSADIAGKKAVIAVDLSTVALFAVALSSVAAQKDQQAILCENRMVGRQPTQAFCAICIGLHQRLAAPQGQHLTLTQPGRNGRSITAQGGCTIQTCAPERDCFRMPHAIPPDRASGRFTWPPQQGKWPADGFGGAVRGASCGRNILDTKTKRTYWQIRYRKGCISHWSDYRLPTLLPHRA